LIDDLNKLKSRTGNERGLLMEAFVFLCLIRIAVLLVPFQRIAGFLGLIAQETPAMQSSAEQKTAATSIGWAVRAAAYRIPWAGQCLSQALAAMMMLKRRGISCVLYLGVAKDLNGQESLAAHAWLTCGDVFVTGEGGHEKFSVLAKFVVKGGR